MTVQEMATDVFRFGGWFGDNWATETPYSNAYVLRKGDDLVVYDTSAFQDIRQRMLETMKRYEKECRNLYVIIGHSHFDHCGNNDLIEEVDFPEKHVVVAEPGLPRLDLVAADRAAVEEEIEYYDHLGTYPYLALRVANRVSPRLALALRSFAVARAWREVRPMADRAEALRLDQRETFTFGDVQFEGWRVGELYLILDGAHLSDHCCLYDAERRLLLVGDLTVEVNPEGVIGSVEGLVDYCDRFARMAAQGLVELVGDGHRNAVTVPQMFQRYGAAYGAEPFGESQLVDVIEGREMAVEFFQGFRDYYADLRDSVVQAHRQLGTASVAQIAEALAEVDTPALRLKRILEFPRFPSWIQGCITSVLKDQRCRRIGKGKGAVFEPAASSG